MWHLLTVVFAFVLMEGWAWFSHKYIMHGFLWVLHKDHHIRTGKRLERNDWFAFIFAIPSFLLIYGGLKFGYSYAVSFGFGIALYGLAYFLFHDLYVHRRIPLGKVPSNKYLRAIHKAHQDHHRPHSHSNFGFLIAPIKYYRDEFKSEF